VERTGMMIGRYKLLQQIGEGGFGVVFMAEQMEPVQRKVALKIIKAGMDTREVIARFEAERQALALMDHPNIARVLDAGTTEAQRPFFVMELVRGMPITDYCDENNLSTRDRLELFIKVCRAVQHAHQKGVIHRDLKPGNVLVTLHDGEPVPKVIDFGVAKALGQKLTTKTLFTRFEQMIGTPAYMSPEQAVLGGLDIDTRSDIYSLGVLLYELLTGVTPLDGETLRQGALDEIRRMIRETDPPKPSTRLLRLGNRLAEVAKHRQVQPAALSRLIRGDLDWITMKALEKDRQRRYETVNSLTSDIQHHLSNKPVTACPPSNFYRLHKWIRRNKLVFIAASSVSATLCICFAILTLAYHRVVSIVVSKDREVLDARLKEAVSIYERSGAGALRDWVRNQPPQKLLVRLTAPSNNAVFIVFIGAPAEWIEFPGQSPGVKVASPKAALFHVPQESDDFGLSSVRLSNGSVLEMGRSAESRKAFLDPLRRQFIRAGVVAVALGLLLGAFLFNRVTKRGRPVNSFT